MSKKRTSNELASNFPSWNNLIDKYLFIECQAEQMEDGFKININKMLADIICYFTSCIKAKDGWEIATSTSHGRFSLFSLVRSKKLCAEIRFGIDRDEFYMSSYLEAAPYLKNMDDAFWGEVLSLSLLGKFEFSDSAVPQMNKKSEAEKIMRHNKSQLFRLIRNYLFLEITEGSTIDLGAIELYWPIKTPLLTILQNGVTAFEKIYRINYALYRAEYLCFRNEVRESHR